MSRGAGAASVVVLQAGKFDDAIVIERNVKVTADEVSPKPILAGDISGSALLFARAERCPLT
jgi:hypothetical protein